MDDVQSGDAAGAAGQANQQRLLGWRVSETHFSSRAVRRATLRLRQPVDILRFSHGASLDMFADGHVVIGHFRKEPHAQAIFHIYYVGRRCTVCMQASLGKPSSWLAQAPHRGKHWTDAGHPSIHHLSVRRPRTWLTPSGKDEHPKVLPGRHNGPASSSLPAPLSFQ